MAGDTGNQGRISRKSSFPGGDNRTEFYQNLSNKVEFLCAIIFLNSQSVFHIKIWHKDIHWDPSVLLRLLKWNHCWSGGSFPTLSF